MSFAQRNNANTETRKSTTISPLSSLSTSPKVSSALTIPTIEEPPGNSHNSNTNNSHNSTTNNSSTNLSSTFANALRSISRRNSSSSVCSAGSNSNLNSSLANNNNNTGSAENGFENELTSWMKNKLGSGVKLFENSLLAVNNNDNGGLVNNSSDSNNSNTGGLFFESLGGGSINSSIENTINSGGKVEDTDDTSIERSKSPGNTNRRRIQRMNYLQLIRQVNKQNWSLINKNNKCHKCQIRIPVLKKFLHLSGNSRQQQLQLNDSEVLSFFSHNCVLCGCVYCEDHLRCVVKAKLIGKDKDELQLTKSTDSDGVPVKCCLKCHNENFLMYKYNEDFVTVKDRFSEFKQQRERLIEAKNLEQVQILRRLQKYYNSLVRIYQNYYIPGSNNTIENSFFKKIGAPGRLLKFQEERKSLDRQYMQFWQDERTTKKCNICKKMFKNADSQFSDENSNLLIDALGALYSRRHHCRLCGIVTCDDNCSMEVPIRLYSKVVNEMNNNNNDDDNTDTNGEYILRKMTETNEVLRICQNCKQIVFKRTSSNLNERKKNDIMENIERMMNLKSRIDMEIPQLQNLLSELAIVLEQYECNDTDAVKKTVDDTILKIQPLKVNITRFLTIFEKNYKRMVDSKEDTLVKDNEKMFLFSGRAYGARYLQDTADYLRQLQKLLIRRESIEKSKKRAMESQAISKVDLKEIAKIKRLREELMILKEQEYLISENIDASVKNRKLDEVVTLKENLLELKARIKEISELLGDEYGF